MHHVYWILEACTELHALRLDVLDSDDDLDDDDVAQLIESMRNLRYLHLIGPSFLDAALLNLLENCKQLQKLYVFDFQDSEADEPEDTYLDCESAAGASAPLTVLHVYTISTPTLVEVLHNYPNLTNVGIGQSTVDSFDSALQLLHSHNNVQEIHLCVPRGCTFASIHLLQDLTALYLHHCAGLSNEHLLTIARNNPHLTLLRVYNANLITSEALLEVASMCQKLTSLRFDNGSGGFTKKQKHIDSTLKALCPSLIDLDVYVWK